MIGYYKTYFTNSSVAAVTTPAAAEMVAVYQNNERFVRIAKAITMAISKKRRIDFA